MYYRFGFNRSVKPAKREAGRSAFSFLKLTHQSNRMMELMCQVGRSEMKGVSGFMDLPLAMQEHPDYVRLSCFPSPAYSPATLNDTILPNLPSGGLKGVVVDDTGLNWLTSHLVVEYSKIASWVATGLQDGSHAVVVFTVEDEKIPLGLIIEL